MATELPVREPGAVSDGGAAVDELERAEGELQDRGRAAMGFTGDAANEPFWRTLRTHRVGVYPLVTLGVLAVVDGLQANAFGIMGPEISRALGVGRGTIGGLFLMQQIALVLCSLPAAALVERRPIRALVCKVTALGWSAATLLTGFVTGVGPFAALMAVDGATSASVGAVHQPLLMDSYPTGVRARVTSVYFAFLTGASIGAPLLIALLAGPLDFTWRGVMLVSGLICFAASLVSLGLHDPGFGRWDTAAVRAAVRAQEGATPGGGGEYELRFFEIARRLLAVQSFRRVLSCFVVVGMLSVPIQVFLSFYLAERWGLDPVGRAAFYSALAGTGVVAILVLAPLTERLFHGDPARLLRVCVALQVVQAVSFPLALLAPSFPLMTALFLPVSAATIVQRPLLSTAYLSVIRSQMRPHASALAGIFQFGVGGIAGLLLLTGLNSQYGTVPSLIAVTLTFSLLAAVVLHRGVSLIGSDLDRTVGEIIEEEELAAIAARGERLPMLACRHLDFSYGQLQVLFGVDFTVDEGELVALLGTNGAGKSTLLRVISGLGIPSRGTVRFRGGDITYLEAPRRVCMGITQVPGGRAVFGNLSVVDNLRAFAYTQRGERSRVDRGIEESFAAFPRLAERRNQPASTLSGGEQQMLGLAKALILEPRLLLIDELSLGLAPKIVAELLDMVRTVNARGTAVVLVEQSVNVALSVARHAYFMEKGEIRFDGGSEELLARPDLLRSVFLEGAAKVLGSEAPAGTLAGPAVARS